MMEHFPEGNCLITSYNERMARRFSRMARTIYAERNKIDINKNSSDEWQTPEGGVCMARGTGNAPTGQGFGSLIAIDDPIANREQANSSTYRENVWDWYTSDILTRLEPRGKLLITMTPWHEDDLSVRAVASEPDKWHILSLPAIAEDDDPLLRKPGEALWPERYDVDALLRIKKVIGDYSFQGLYQVNPTAKQGSFFKINEIKYVDTAPNNLMKVVRSYDLAATENDGDFTCGVKVGIDNNNNIYILDVLRGQWSPETRDRYIKNTADADGKILISIPEDPGSAGKFQSQYLIRMLAGNNIIKLRPTTKKELRAEPFASQLNAGNVFMVKAEWNRNLLEELRQFPLSKHDDQVDCLSDAFSALFAQRKFAAL